MDAKLRVGGQDGLEGSSAPVSAAQPLQEVLELQRFGFSKVWAKVRQPCPYIALRAPGHCGLGCSIPTWG